MKISDRLRQLFVGTAEDDDPSAMREVEVVSITEGPMVVERLREQGIEAMALDSFDAVTASQTHTRIMVRNADLAAARQVLGVAPPPGAEPVALEAYEDDDGDEPDAEAELAAQQAMSRLYVVADRLVARPGDAALQSELDELAEVVGSGPPPFGIDRSSWRRVAQLAAAVAEADEEGGDVAGAAQALRDALHPMV